MSIFFNCLVLMIFLIFESTTLQAETLPGHIIIAADQSSSMFDSRNIDIQTSALVDSLSTYHDDCTPVRLTYVAWGGSLLQKVVTGRLDNAESRYWLASEILKVSSVNLQGTSHETGYFEAKKFALLKESTAMIFITDGGFVDDYDSGVVDEPSFVVHKIAIESKDAKWYLERRFLSGVGTMHFAEDADDLQKVVTDVMMSVQRNLCLG